MAYTHSVKNWLVSSSIAKQAQIIHSFLLIYSCSFRRTFSSHFIFLLQMALSIQSFYFIAHCSIIFSPERIRLIKLNNFITNGFHASIWNGTFVISGEEVQRDKREKYSSQAATVASSWLVGISLFICTYMNAILYYFRLKFVGTWKSKQRNKKSCIWCVPGLCAYSISILHHGIKKCVRILSQHIMVIISVSKHIFMMVHRWFFA